MSKQSDQKPVPPKTPPKVVLVRADLHGKLKELALRERRLFHIEVDIVLEAGLKSLGAA